MYILGNPYLRANKIYYKNIYQPVLLEDLQLSIVHDIQNCIHKLGLSDLREFLQICQCILYTSGQSGTQHILVGILLHFPYQRW